MNYLTGIGLGANDEKRILESLLHERKREPYSPNITFSELFSIFEKLDSKGSNTFHLASQKERCLHDVTSHLDVMMSHMLFPLTNSEVIATRQKIVELYIDSYRNGKNENIVSLTSAAVISNYELLKYFTGITECIDINAIANKFYILATSLIRLEKSFAGTSLTQGFSERIRGIFEENPVGLEGHLYMNGGSVLLESATGSFSLIDKPDLIEKNGVALGHYRRKESEGCNKRNFYPSDKQDYARIKQFAMDSAVLTNLLGAFLYQAVVYHKARQQGIHACIPQINNQRVFEVVDALPIATRLSDNDFKYVPRLEKAVNFDFRYDRTDNKVIIGGAHSGGKTELLKNIAAHLITGLSGFVSLAKYANIPLTKRIITHFDKAKEGGKGSLENEVNELLRIESSLGQDDVLLIDEFLDTAKPEVARYLAEPIVNGEEGLLPGFANNPATIIIVDHRINSIPETSKFRLIHPTLKEIQSHELVINEGYGWGSYLEKAGKSMRILVPTHKFAKGKPDPKLTSKHAKQMWEEIKLKADLEAKIEEERRKDLGLNQK